MSAVDSAQTPLATRTDNQLMREEGAIAREYLGRVPWEMVAWGLGNFAVWVSLFPLVLLDILPLWAGFVIATLNCMLAYLPSHEAQHSIIGAEGTKLRWLNELVGHLSTIPLAFPYRVAWITHKQHHAHANDEELDPDLNSRGDTWYQSVWNSMKGRQGGTNDRYARTMRESDDPKKQRALLEAFALRTFHFGTLAVMAWSGYAIEAALLWWVPRHIGFSYLTLFLSWAPHHPMNEMGRYRDTRVWKSPVGTMGSMWMEFHLIHHLYPKIPLLDTGPAWRALEPILIERGIRDDRDRDWQERDQPAA